MPTLITQTSNPALWADLEAVRSGSQWVYLGQEAYKPVVLDNGSWAFNYYTQQELYDSGSLSNPAGGSYGDLE